MKLSFFNYGVYYNKQMITLTKESSHSVDCNTVTKVFIKVITITDEPVGNIISDHIKRLNT
jgi:hypothetical protein